MPSEKTYYLTVAGAFAGGLLLSSAPVQRVFRRVWATITNKPASPKYGLEGGAKIHDYLVSHGVRGTKELAELHKATHAKYGRLAGMMSSPDAIAVHQLCVKLIGAKKAIEVGVFTGYATLGLALALPPEGEVIACDVSEDYANLGKPYWKSAGVDGKIDLRIGPALDTLKALVDGGGSGTFDIGFIDADKGGYDEYYELLMQLVRPGGMIMIDNTLWPARRMDESGQAIDGVNKKVHEDSRIEALCMLKNADGITLALKK